jgi:aminoglycoside phosphotransferase (APT) family kinase protein
MKITKNQLKLSFPDLENINPIIKIGNGFESIVVKTNSDIVFKIGKNSYSQNSYKTEFNLLKIFKPYFQDIAIPNPIHYKSSTLEFPFGIIGYKNINGKPLSQSDITLSSEDNYVSQFVNILNTLHSIPLTAEIRKLNLSRYPPSKKKLQELWRLINPVMKKEFTNTEFKKCVFWWKNLLKYASFNLRASNIVHLDLWYENILINDDNKIVGILDFSNVSLGDPIGDFVPFSYISDEFMIKIIKKLQLNNNRYVKPYLNERIFFYKGLRELYGLEYGIKTGKIDEDTFLKIRKVIIE